MIRECDKSQWLLAKVNRLTSILIGYCVVMACFSAIATDVFFENWKFFIFILLAFTFLLIVAMIFYKKVVAYESSPDFIREDFQENNYIFMWLYGRMINK